MSEEKVVVKISAILCSILKGQDQLSEVFNSMANSGARAVEQWYEAGNVANKSFTQATNGANTVDKAINLAITSTNEWTTATGNYNKSALEAIYTTEDLVQMGYKKQESLTASTEELDKTSETLQKSIQETENFKNTTSELESELKELQQAYIGVAIQKGNNLEEAQTLQKEITNLSEVIKGNKKQWEDLDKEAKGAGDTTSQTFSKMQKSLEAAGIIKLTDNITANVKEMANEFSKAEATIIKATGASGTELNNLRDNMFNVFANSSSDLSSVAEAITKVNTAFDVQGQELEQVTSLFIDYANVNGTKVASSVEEVSKLMSGFGIEVEHTEQVLDQFTLASQMSGVSVDKLSSQILKNQATLDSLGYDLEKSISLFAMLEHNGINTEAVMTGLNYSVVKLSKEGKNAGEALKEVVEEISNLSDEADATALAVESFGEKAGPEMAFAIRSGKLEMDEWVEALGHADGTLAETANSATTLKQQWTQASNQMSMAFSSVLSPAVAGVSGAFADLYGKMGEILAANPEAVIALSVLAASFVALTGAVVAYNAAVAATVALKAALAGAIAPIVIGVGAVTALTAIILSLSNSQNAASQGFKELTATSKLHYEEVERLNAKHQEAVIIYGENSDEVRRLAGELEGARLVYQANKVTMEEFIAQNERLVTAQRKTTDSYYDSISSIDAEEKSAMQLITRLTELSSQTELTASEQHQMSAIIDSLNNQLPDLALSYNEVTGALNLSTESIREMAKVEAEQLRLDAQRKACLEVINQEVLLNQQLAVAADEVAAAKQRADEVGGRGRFGSSRQAKKDLELLENQYDELKKSLEEISQLQADIERGFENAGIEAEEAALTTVDSQEAVRIALGSVKSDLKALAIAYDEAYESALQSISGQYNLWDEADEVVAKSVGNINSNLEGQIEYWQSYNENLSNLGDRSSDIEGLAELIATFADGSTDSINMIAGMADATDEELAEMVANWQLLQEEQSNVSHSLADLTTDFSNSLEEIEDRMHASIENMNMEEGATLAARSTMTAYINEILASTEDVHSAIKAVTGADFKLTSGEFNAYAKGTMSAAPGLALVGEEGPELVNFRGGETVFTANQTSRILSNTHTPVETKGMNLMQNFSSEQKINHSAKEEKRITLDITGKGEIDVSGVDEDTVWDFVSPKLKEEFMHIIRDEIFEEGDMSYDF